jgi:hypothetical protein
VSGDPEPRDPESRAPAPRDPAPRVFRGEPLLDILAYLERALAAGASELALCVLDPDLARGSYAGERIEHAGALHVHRPLRVWLDVAERLGLRLLTPRAGDDGLITVRFERLVRADRDPRASGPRASEPRADPRADPRASDPRANDPRVEPANEPRANEPRANDPRDAPRDDPRDATRGGVNSAASPRKRGRAGPLSIERYGQASSFARIAKLEDPGFVLDLADALARARLGERPRVLDLGVNTGDELTLVLRAYPDADITGIDHSASALATARARFPAARFVEADLGALAALGLGAFDLVISLSTLQSPGVDDRALLRQVVQHHLTPRGAIILGLPNSRYVDGEVSYGARMKNFRQPELGLLIKDVAFYRKYLQQHDRQVFVTGKYYLLVTGVAAGAPETATPDDHD